MKTINQTIKINERYWNTFLKVALVAGFTTFQCGNLWGQNKYDAKNDSGAQSIVDASRTIKPSTPTSSVRIDENSIRNILASKLTEAGIRQSWHEEKNRFGGVAVYKFQIDPSSSFEEYFIFRQAAALGALITAQMEVARWLGANASMEVARENPGDPFFQDKFNESAKREIEDRINKLNQESAALGVQMDKADGDANNGVTTWDRFKVASDALVKKLDKDYDPKQISQEKFEKANKIKGDVEATQKQIQELKNKYEEYREAYKKSLTAGIALNYDHVIFGLSAVSWAENLSPSGELQVGMAYIWSPKLAQSAYAALVGEPNLDSDNVKGDESLDSWLGKQDLSTIGAFRYYVDNNGDRWFIGSSATPNSVDGADQIASLSAIMNLYMPLYSRLVGSQKYNLEVRSGKLPAKAAQEMLEDLKSFVKDANTRGIQQVSSKDIIWPAKNSKNGAAEDGSVIVAIQALSAKSAAAALKANVQMALAAAATERENNRRRLEQAQLLGIVNAAKKEVPASRVPGLVNKAQPANAPSAVKTPVQQSKSTSDNNLSPQPGVKVTPGKTQDDF
jgi:hypothetical protein